MTDDTRRCIVQGLIDRGVTQFALRPLDGPEESRQEVVVMAGLEALHSLPCCDPPTPPPPPETEILVVQSATLNIRDHPVAPMATVLRTVGRGTALTVEKAVAGTNTYIWRKLAGEAAYAAEKKADGSEVYLVPKA